MRVIPYALLAFCITLAGVSTLREDDQAEMQALLDRGAIVHDPVRVPDEVGSGRAKVTVSFPAWKGAKVVPTTLEVPGKRS